MKITTNFIQQNFKGAIYVRGETVNKADAMCRTIATELEFDKIVKSPAEDLEDELLAQDEEIARINEDEETNPDKLFGILPCPSSLFLDLRKASGIEEEPEAQAPHDKTVKSRFIIPEIHRKIDIKA